MNNLLEINIRDACNYRNAPLYEITKDNSKPSSQSLESENNEN